MEYKLNWKQKAWLEAADMDFDQYLKEYPQLFCEEEDDEEEPLTDEEIANRADNMGNAFTVTEFYTAEEAAEIVFETYERLTGVRLACEVPDFEKFMDDVRGFDNDLFTAKDDNGNTYYFWLMKDRLADEEYTLVHGIDYILEGMQEVTPEQVQEWMRKYNLNLNEDGTVKGRIGGYGLLEVPYITSPYDRCRLDNASGSTIEYLIQHEDRLWWLKI